MSTDLEISTVAVEQNSAYLFAAAVLALNRLQPEYCMNLNGLAAETGMHREIARAVMTVLRERRLVIYQRGLWGEDDMPAGAGYRLSDMGREAAADLIRRHDAAAVFTTKH